MWQTVTVLDSTGRYRRRWCQACGKSFCRRKCGEKSGWCLRKYIVIEMFSVLLCALKWGLEHVSVLNWKIWRRGEWGLRRGGESWSRSWGDQGREASWAAVFGLDAVGLLWHQTAANRLIGFQVGMGSGGTVLRESRESIAQGDRWECLKSSYQIREQQAVTYEEVMIQRQEMILKSIVVA